MKDDNVIQLRPRKLLQESGDPQLVPELFFSTKKRHDLRTRCRKCMCNFRPEKACPNCGSTELEPFVGAEPIKQRAYDAEATLNEIDPEWRERFHGDSGAALDYYMKLL